MRKASNNFVQLEEENNEQPKQYKTPDDLIQELGFGKFQIILMFIAGSCWMIDSMVIF